MELAVTYDYRCPFARVAHLTVLDGLADGGGWDVRFVPFCMGQLHVADGQAPIWDRPGDDTGLLALQASVVVRDHHPELFGAVHRSLFGVRHEHGRRLDEEGVDKVLADHGVPLDDVHERIRSGEALATVRADHERAATDDGVWGVPTFSVGGQTAFVRLLEVPSEAAEARLAVERIIALVGGWPALDELKHTVRRR